MRRYKEEAGHRAVYHCFTRSVNGEVLFDQPAREFLRGQLWKVAAFSGVNVITYCLMGNHFHVLVEVPEGGPPVEDAELIRRYRILYPKGDSRNRLGLPLVLEERLAGGGAEADRIRQGLRRRMGDISPFMGLLKQRFSVWFNRTHERFGTLWAEPFKSVLIEGTPESPADESGTWQTVAAYIDLNPVRAGLTERPEDYRWSGYAEAVAGNRQARSGISRLFGRPWREAVEIYRLRLHGRKENGGNGAEAGAAVGGGAGGSGPDNIAATGNGPGAKVCSGRALKWCEVTVGEAMAVREMTSSGERRRPGEGLFACGVAVGHRDFAQRHLERYRQLTGRRKRCSLLAWLLKRAEEDILPLFSIRAMVHREMAKTLARLR